MEAPAGSAQDSPSGLASRRDKRAGLTLALAGRSRGARDSRAASLSWGGLQSWLELCRAPEGGDYFRRTSFNRRRRRRRRRLTSGRDANEEAAGGRTRRAVLLLQADNKARPDASPPASAINEASSRVCASHVARAGAGRLPPPTAAREAAILCWPLASGASGSAPGAGAAALVARLALSLPSRRRRRRRRMMISIIRRNRNSNSNSNTRRRRHRQRDTSAPRLQLDIQVAAARCARLLLAFVSELWAD